ncbi:hypothetical protein E5E91_02660 [Deinococcus radiodurans R1 = ATCC 13939 = DSM 20539]|uniref:Uncharacterized protein n=1 Tax=Deinococcus radiodurans (strain ATCC 13939 / DSM 20539 / JCM 16871 / CCUG 27074 / LMG 4051 / NBRC 15346 / NCIMB 9279 / VKM B-1422 / R1) TaxID=243230 RepID=Q9RX01_DEIRA|nr:hypothetical protein DR_0514 [Deinococcus radiodurans R1 = ATCC 13939 = DSM 20539]QEM72463.1 hypothetical protein DXG80_12255 [Deinococcus radiodurans]UDK99696.1 hypothetical protein E5E91_02660 [Deinococcus radiodurans R1 = ATCC 13939 = DSM 20539]HCE64983.1 hypothetical protein [Deinococcus radiodurans]
MSRLPQVFTVWARRFRFPQNRRKPQRRGLSVLSQKKESGGPFERSKHRHFSSFDRLAQHVSG